MLISNCSFTYLSMRVLHLLIQAEHKDVFFAVWCSDPNDNDTQCSVDPSGQRWTCSSGRSNFSCLVNDSKREILCVDKQHCPYAEESQQIHITVYMRTEEFLVENYSKHFYLSEIGETRLFFCAQLPFTYFYSFSSRLCFHLTPSFAFTLDSET